MTAISGAAGITNADVACRRSLACQEYPGSRTSLVAKADAALGAALPSNQHESDYVATSDSGLLLALDARLDNRSELVRSLNLSRNDLGYARLVAAAWERWGEDALDHIIGDFAVAVYDTSRRILALARDPTGQVPLFFRTFAQGAGFASLPNGLREVAGLASSIEPSSLARYLAGIDPVDGQTSFAEIKAVRPGEIVRIASGSIERRRPR